MSEHRLSGVKVTFGRDSYEYEGAGLGAIEAEAAPAQGGSDGELGAGTS